MTSTIGASSSMFQSSLAPTEREHHLPAPHLFAYQRFNPLSLQRSESTAYRSGDSDTAKVSILSRSNGARALEAVYEGWEDFPFQSSLAPTEREHPHCGR